MTLPFFHISGQFGLFPPLLCGAVCVLPSPHFSPSTTIRVGAAQKCTIILGTPTMHMDILNLQDFHEFDLNSLRLALIGGATSCPSLIREMKDKYTVDRVFVSLELGIEIRFLLNSPSKYSSYFMYAVF